MVLVRKITVYVSFGIKGHVQVYKNRMMLHHPRRDLYL